jgi:enoyl-CoA hydratase/carnithine racemase
MDHALPYRRWRRAVQWRGAVGGCYTAAMTTTPVDLGSTHLHGTKSNGVLKVVIDRPERRNAMTVEMYHGVKKAAVLAEKDPEVEVLLLTAEGDYFCVGGEMGGKHEGGQLLDRETDGLDLTPFVQLERCPKIIVVGINGMCQGGGLVITMMSDVSIVSDRARFRVPELLRGVADCYYGARLATRVGMAKAKYLLFTASYFSAEEASDMGLVSRVVPHAELEEAVAETIDLIKQTAPRARTLLKRDLNRQLPRIDHEMFAESLRGEEVAEGFAAFVAKRPPSWVR